MLTPRLIPNELGFVPHSWVLGACVRCGAYMVREGTQAYYRQTQEHCSEANKPVSSELADTSTNTKDQNNDK